MVSYRVAEHKLPCQYIRDWPRATASDEEATLYLSVKQYIPIDNPDPKSGDITIIGAHANGFPKELYEPLWDDLIQESQKYGFRIRSIWMADVAHQGASSVLNEGLLGNDPSWLDHSRDLLHLINMKRDQMPRPLIGLGHSMGGAQLANLAYFHPRLFTTLILVDPVIQTQTAEVKPNSIGIAQLSTFRRDTWPSREVALASFKRSPFYQTWDSRVLDRWMQYGLRDLPTALYPDSKPPEVTLSTTVSQEVFTYLRPNYDGYGKDGKPVDRTTHPDLNPDLPNISPFYRPEAPVTFQRLPELRPSVLYLFGSTSTTSNAKNNEAKMARTGVGVGGSGGRAAGRVKGITFEGIGHLIAMEAVERTAQTTAEWIDTEMKLYREQEEVFRKWRDEKSLREKQVIDDEWKRMMGGPPSKRSGGGGKKESKI